MREVGESNWEGVLACVIFKGLSREDQAWSGLLTRRMSEGARDVASGVGCCI